MTTTPTPSTPAGTARPAAGGPPEFRSGKASRRFLRNLFWLLLIGGLFLAGQGVRYYLNYRQVVAIQAETDALYRSVLGPDIGGSPFGRLQFEHGKLLAAKRIGLAPLGVLAALSRPAGEKLRVDGVSLTGTRGRVRGYFSGDEAGFMHYMEKLSDDDRYLFSVYKIDELGGGVSFSLSVEPK
ncbi:hypothetical protein DND132_2323 [Pseudodesulfovibrio mercurii]|uniref:Uncharacterized protein n=1 Tax=Pseudodesulfovibrio mercurii TaxID=641491 RepID=F0JBM4_9BACT|nr:hypothetical protein [Pseudodesulfovibrio mercurii]EGB15527.1 hypothetical protein DND132_2323 [Pseudodesulfovibrio mercurii]